MGLLKIKSFRLVNIQSWDNNTPTIEFSEDKNIIIANSETGKSVLFKVLKQMCFTVWGYKNSDLIRQGASKGLAVFDLINGNRVVFELLPNTQNYYLCFIAPDGSKRRKDFIMGTKSVEIPEEVANQMGFLLDRKSKTIINVLDRDMLMPLVTTSPATSGRILSAVTENPELESMMDTAKSWLKEAKDKRDSVKSSYLSAKYNYDSVEYRDTKVVQNTIALLKTVRTLGEVFNRVEAKGDSVRNHLSVKPKYLKSFNYLSFLEIMKDLVEIKKSGDSLRENLGNAPKNLGLEFEDLAIIKLFQQLTPIIENGSTVKSFVETRPIEVKMPVELKCFKMFMETSGLKLLEEGRALREVYIKKPTPVKFSKFLEFSLTVMSIGIREKGVELVKILQRVQELEKKKELSSVKFEEVKNKTDFCPLCLRPYGGEGSKR